MSKQLCIGILGGGQLARMSGYAAYRLGFELAIMEKEPDSPAGQMTKYEYAGEYDNYEALDRLIEKADVITLENEFIDYKVLEYIESKGKRVVPGSETIRLIQDKYVQKETLRDAGIAVPRFFKAEPGGYGKLEGELGSRFILKSRKMGYDGYGNAMVRNEAEYEEAIKRLAQRNPEVMAEEFVPFVKELAVMAVRNGKGTAVYPVTETIQKDHICHTVIAPAQVSADVRRRAEETALAAVSAVKGTGIFGVEMFLLEDGSVLVNEMAPRPHNSGHYTIEGCVTSQFENHVRAAAELPLGSTEMVKPYAVMVNLLGKKDGPGAPESYDEVLGEGRVHLHVYGKRKSRVGRKMGHVTVVSDNLEEARAAAGAASYKF